MELFNLTTVDLIAVKLYPPSKLRGVIESTESLDLSFLHPPAVNEHSDVSTSLFNWQ